MKIEQSSFGMAASHQLASRYERTEQAQIWLAAPPTPAKEPAVAPVPPAAIAAQDPPAASDMHPTPTDELKMTLVRMLLESVTGKAINLQPVDIPPVDPSAASANADVQHLAEKKGQIEAQGNAARAQAEAPRLPAGAGISLDVHERYTESESTTFHAQGKVTTADGQEIAIDLQVSMSRSFMVQNDLHFQAGDVPVKDPLVVNYAGTAAELSSTKMKFAMDAGGEPDQVSFLKSGSGFLALDKNADGKINNGSELFGAVSGNGFAELSRYDTDHNGWIDSGDAVYQDLRVWSFDEKGQPELVALGQKGIGAIYVGHVETPFDLKQSDGQLNGKVRQTGIFLREDGSAGSVQQVDLAV